MNVKGSALRARVQFAREKGGESYERFLAALAPATRAIVNEQILPSQWYPFTAFIDLCEVLDRVHGHGDLALCRQLGRYGCDVNLTTLYKIFFKVGSVAFIIRRSAAAWRVNYSEGTMLVIDEGERFVLMRMQVPVHHRAHCLSVLGWTERAMEISGAREVKTTERCRLLGDKECEFDLRWK